MEVSPCHLAKLGTPSPEGTSPMEAVRATATDKTSREVHLPLPGEVIYDLVLNQASALISLGHRLHVQPSSAVGKVDARRLCGQPGLLSIF